ncbi:MAG: D-alanyl-D-alanine carboxypeptidase/D-alanyl-D-alanine-endopeptidase [Ignavibacteriales bacterium]|nr:D-alanyl-D-alanine carboxypeptidase/D-alanyl-D-alanine-endopeptidase [Ignavibacteriales bacterium]
MKKILLILLISFTSIFSKDYELIKRLDKILETLPRGTKYGILIYNPNTKDTLFSANSTMPIKPASNIKLFTTAVSLSSMGSDYPISTKLLSEDFKLDDGILNGNLYIKGFGNSIFTDHDIDSLVSVIKTIGIKKITGKIVGDDTYFDNEYKRSDWIIDEADVDPLQPVSALSINRNKIQISLRASVKTGGSISYSLFPECSLIDIKNLAKTTKRKSSIHISQNFLEGKYEIIISGGLKRRTSGSYSVEIENPPLFAAELLKDRLIKSGITVLENAVIGETPKDVNELCEKSIPLKYLCNIANKRSDNFIAECLFKTLGAYFSESQGSGFFATQAILSFLKENHIYSDNVVIVDGSGLSHQNQVTVLTIVNLLDRIYRNPEIYFDYYNSLSIAGRDGTLRNRQIGSNAENNFHGKTGSLHGVLSLSGYMKSKSGNDLIISMLFEYERAGKSTYKTITDRIVEML